MSIINVIVGAFIGVLLADHYKVDRVKSVLASVILGFINVWIFLHLTVRRHWSTGKAVGVMIVGWLLLFWFIFTAAFIVGLATADTVVRS